MKKVGLVLGLIAGVVLVISAVLFLAKKGRPERKVGLKKLKVSSPAFNFGDNIPRKYTCEGENVNPPLEISNLPEEAKSLVLIVEDPDAPLGTWYHWIVYNIDPRVKKIEEGKLPKGGSEVKNSFGYKKYGGPCPPPGKSHRYYFKVYALSRKLSSGIKSKEDLERELEKSAIAYGELMGKFGR